MNADTGAPHTAVLMGKWLGLGLLTWAAVAYAGRTPIALPAYAVPHEFSAGRAMTHVQQMTYHTHPTGSVGNAAVRASILGELRVLGLKPIVQTTTGIGTRYPAAGRVNNVLVRVPGSHPSIKSVLLMAHYDAVPAAPGAGDDASGVATLLETLRALRSGPQLRNDVIALFTDGEEPGLLGAAAFVREHPWSREVGVVMNFEARGTRGPSLMFETGPGNLDVVRMLRRVRGVRATSLSTAVYRALPNDTDLSEFASLEVPALNFAFIGGVNRYHTAEDDVAHLDPRSVQHHGDQALALARAFGNAELPRPKTSDAVFFNFPVAGLIVYAEGWAIPLAILATILAVAVAYRNRDAAAWPKAVLVGALATLAAAVVSAAAGYGLGIAFLRLHEMLRSGAPESSGVYALAIALSAVAISTGAFALVSRRLPRGAHGGALVAWAVLGLVVAFVFPGASFLFVWPLLLVAAASFVRRDGVPAMAAMWSAAAMAVFVVVPIVYLLACVALGVNQVGGAVIALFAALTVALLAPLLAPENDPRPWWTPPFAAAGAVALMVIGAATVRTNAAHPGGASLVYAADADSAGAWLSGYAYNATSRATLRRFINDVRAKSGESSAGQPPAWMRRTFSQAGIVAVRRTDFPRSEAAVLSDSTVGAERRVTIRVRPGPGVASVSMSAETGNVLRATVDSKLVPTDRYRMRSRQWSLSYVAPPDSGFVLGLVIPAASEAALAITTRSEGMPPLQLPPRPDGIVPFQGGNMTWLYFRLRL